MVSMSGRGYFAGRALSLLLVWGGVLAVVSGAAVVGCILANVVVVVDFLKSVPGFGGLVSGVLLLAGGTGLIFVGQFMQAIFEIANATRAMAELERYRAERDGVVDNRWS